MVISLAKTLAIVLVLLPCLGCGPSNTFPNWTVGSLQFCGSYHKASIIAIGRLFAVTPIGAQPIEKAPWPVAPVFKRVYWCQGRLSLARVLKGELRATEGVFVWGTVRPCEVNIPFFGHKEGRTQVWLLRQEGELLRPTVDAGGIYYVGFDDDERSFPAGSTDAIGLSLLRPPDDPVSIGRFVLAFDNLAREACCVLGIERCTPQIAELLRHRDLTVRKAAASYLHRQ